MKTNESILRAHGWEKRGSDWFALRYQYYSKEINNWEIFIILYENGDYLLSQDEFPNDVETYIAIAEELKLLNAESDHKIIKLKERI